MSNVTTEPGVEECLRELREMFPGETLEVDASAWHWSKDGDDADPESDAKITVGFGHHARDDKVFYAPNLSEAMAQVRAWKESQK